VVWGATVRKFRRTEACQHRGGGSLRSALPWKEKGASEPVYKPGPVPKPEGRATIIHLRRRLPDGFSDQTQGHRTDSPPLYLVLLRMGFTKHPQLPTGLVSSYLTVSPLPGRNPAVYFLWHFPRLATGRR
jgi:hypothetical protein